jgi:hypothetical protein
LQTHQRPERRLAQRAQVHLADAAARERLHRPWPLEMLYLDERVQHGQRRDPVGDC